MGGDRIGSASRATTPVEVIESRWPNIPISLSDPGGAVLSAKAGNIS
jgi:hypothetical protein